MPFVVGLSGGIGSGKSTVTDMFQQLGAEVIDADLIAREVIPAGSPALDAIIQHFGDKILVAGSLDRAMLRKLVFSKPEERRWLEKLLHPLIRAEIKSRIEKSMSKYVILSVPLLLQSQDYEFVDCILWVDCPLELQLERVMLRDGSNEDEVRKIIAAQIPRKEALSRADTVITNDGDLNELRQEVKKLHEHFQRQAGH